MLSAEREGFSAPSHLCAFALKSAFTLIEMLLALAVSAIVLSAVGGVFFSAMRLRERTAAILDESGPLQQALTLVRRDVQGAQPPGGMSWIFKVGPINDGLGMGAGLQCCTTTGTLNNQAPWGDLQEVVYELRPSVAGAGLGKDLIRKVTRNLLATTTADADVQSLLATNVESLEFACFDGTQWRESWDTSLGDTNLPNAVRIRIQLVTDDNQDKALRQPFEMVIPLVTQAAASTNQTQNTGGG